MPTTIDQLDDLSLLRIFDELSIQDLFRAGHVCVWWNAIRSKSANGRKELTLLVGSGAQKYIDEALFRVPERDILVDENVDALIPSKQNTPSNAPFQIESFSVDLACFLYDNLPNLTTLTISCHIDHLDSFTALLERFSSTGQLHTLKLFIDSVDQPFLNALNSIGTLKKLKLNLQFEQEDMLDLPILRQLKEFDISGPERFSCLHDSILRYAVPNLELRSICIDSPVTDFAWMLSLPREFAFRFTHLHLVLDEHYKPPFDRRFGEMCRHFCNLTSLELSKLPGPYWVYPVPFTRIRVQQPRKLALSTTEIFTSLSHVHNLLSLTIDDKIREFIPSHKNQSIPTLPSVKVLTIPIDKYEHREFSTLNLKHYFPCVQTVKFVRASDTECYKCHSECASKFWGFCTLPKGFSLEYCTRHMISELVKCRELKMVWAKLGDNYRQWSVKEINDFANCDNEVDYLSKEFNLFSYAKDEISYKLFNSTEVKDLFDSKNVFNNQPKSIVSLYPLTPCVSRRLSYDSLKYPECSVRNDDDDIVENECKKWTGNEKQPFDDEEIDQEFDYDDLLFNFS